MWGEVASGAVRILPFHPPGQSPAADGVWGRFIFRSWSWAGKGSRIFIFSPSTGQKCIFSCVSSLVFHEVCTSTGESMGSVVKTWTSWLACAAYTFLCVTVVAFVLELMRFEQNNPSVYSFSFHCSLLSVCSPAGGRGSWVQDMNSCLRCAPRLLEVAALFHEVHNFPSSCRIPPLRHAGRVSKYLKYHLLCNYLASPFY